MTERARLGLLLPAGPEASPAVVAERAREAELAGFGSAWTIEDYYSWECFAALGYVAAATERIELGVGITTPYVRSPAVLASAAATLDRCANGRFTLGIGRSTAALLRQIGIADRTPLTMLAETAEALRLLWTGATIDYHGKFVELDRVRLEALPEQGSVPIWFGVLGPKALRAAGRFADGALITTFVGVPYVRWAAEQVRAGAIEAGRDPNAVEIAIMVRVRVGMDRERALDEAKTALALAYAMPGRGELLLRDSGIDLAVLDPMRAALRIDELVAEGLEPYLHALERVDAASVAATVPTDLVERSMVAGDPAACRAGLAAFMAAGATRILVESPQPAAELIAALGE
ncbi:MAG: LLM class flavin-dependent oxidoreductase [Thermomicrobiales bacterium]|nr:LLM class flavin-dependent oxidoreductase [Thermomicrobiales bacterium]